MTLKRKPSPVTSINCEDSPAVQEKKKQHSVSEEFTDGEEENKQKIWESLTPTVTTPEVLKKKLDSLATKDINLLRAEIECVTDSLHNKVDKLESAVFEAETENDKLN